MSQKLAGKVAVVTGGSKGIGAEISRHLAAEGAAVVVNYASSKAGADRVFADIVGQGGKRLRSRQTWLRPKKSIGYLPRHEKHSGDSTFLSTTQGSTNLLLSRT